MTDYSSRSCLVVDNGLFVSLAELLVGKFGKVGYFCPWENGFPDGRELVIGMGIKGITREKYFDSVYKSYDLIVFCDVYSGDLQDDLRSRGVRVWGAGLAGGRLELSRWKTKELMKQIGLPHNESWQIRGLENLRSFLKEHKDVFVKVSTFRGLGETFHSEDYDTVKGQLDELRYKYDAMVDVIDFVVEKNIPNAKEQGYDGYNIDGEFPDKAYIGVEIKDKSYYGMLVDYDSLPNDVRETNTKLSYHMEGYRQFFSTELRNQYPIDLTCRHPSPAGEPEIHAFENIAEILYEGAGGVLIHPKVSAKFVAQIIMCSEWAFDHFLPIFFPEEIRPFVKIYNHSIINGVDYFVPQMAKMKQVGSVIGLGNTPDEACNAAVERAKQIKAYDLEIEYKALDEARKVMSDDDTKQ
jgi:hypothetical protein